MEKSKTDSQRRTTGKIATRGVGLKQLIEMMRRSKAPAEPAGKAQPLTGWGYRVKTRSIASLNQNQRRKLFRQAPHIRKKYTKT